MAESITQKVQNKSGHIFNQVMMGVRKGAQIGAVLGGIIGVGSLLVAGNIATLGAGGVIMGVASFGLFGAVGGSICGLNAGAWIGGIKGLLTRPKPNGEQLINDALNCDDPHKPLPGQEQTAPQVEQQIQAQPQQPQPQQPEQTGPQRPALPKESMAELAAMTQSLNAMRNESAAENPVAPAQPPAAQQQTTAADWRSRMQQAPSSATQQQR